MEKPTVNTLMKRFKQEFKNKHGVQIDFRQHVYLQNPNGLTPTFYYAFAEKLVETAFKIHEDIMVENPLNYPNYIGWVYNKKMECEKLRFTPFKDYLLNIFNELECNFEEQMTAEDFNVCFVETTKQNHVVKVSHSNESFNVVCQCRPNLSCHNDSGSDFNDSGLNVYTQNKLCHDDVQELKAKIETCVKVELKQ